MDIGPGTFVECVDADPLHPGSWADAAGARLKAGAVYQVESVHDLWSAKYGRGSVLVLTSPETKFPCPWPCGWPHQRFRPIYTPKSELFDQLLKAVPLEAAAPGVWRAGPIYIGSGAKS